MPASDLSRIAVEAMRLQNGYALAIDARDWLPDSAFWDTHHLLPRVVRHAGENARLRHGRVTFVFQHTTDWNALVTKKLQQQPPRFVVANRPHWQHVHTKVGEIVDGAKLLQGVAGLWPKFRPMS